MTHKMHIPPNKVEQTRKYFRERGGCVLWKNQEIGVMREEIMTPATHEDGSPATPPHWAYVGTPEVLKPEDIAVRTETIIQPPLDWFASCDACNKTGRRPIQEIADARGVSLDEAKRLLREDTVPRGVRDEDNTVDCWCCQGTGHIERHINVAVRKKYWGLDISETGKKRAAKLAAKLGPDVLWSWQAAGWGIARLVFYKEEIRPFAMEGG